MSCPANALTKSMRLFEDRICGGGPLEWLAAGVVGRDEVVDALHELFDAGGETAWPADVARYLGIANPGKGGSGVAAGGVSVVAGR